MKGFIFAVLIFQSFGANAVILNRLGFLFDDNAEQVFSGQTVFWEADALPGPNPGWEAGALDFNHYSAAAGGGKIFDYFDTSNNATVGGPFNPDNIEIWTDDWVDESTQTLFHDISGTPSLTFRVSDNDGAGEEAVILLEGNLSGPSDTDQPIDFTVTGGALAPWFDTGVLVWNGAFAQDLNGNGNPFTLTMTASPVPVPAAVWLFMTGLIGMGAIARRRTV